MRASWALWGFSLLTCRSEQLARLLVAWPIGTSSVAYMGRQAGYTVPPVAAATLSCKVETGIVPVHGDTHHCHYPSQYRQFK